MRDIDDFRREKESEIVSRVLMRRGEFSLHRDTTAEENEVRRELDVVFEALRAYGKWVNGL